MLKPRRLRYQMIVIPPVGEHRRFRRPQEVVSTRWWGVTGTHESEVVVVDSSVSLAQALSRVKLNFSGSPLPIELILKSITYRAVDLCRT